MTDNFDFFEELFNKFQQTKEGMINKYIKGEITKKQLDEFMERQNGKGK